jgi:preprotein translocase subunit YajC
MKHITTVASTLLLSLIFPITAGAGDATASKASPSAMQTEEKSASNAKGNAAISMKVSKLTATVEAIDMATRTVTLTGAKGKSVVFEAGEEVRNLDQLKVGDKVVVEYFDGIAAEIKSPGASQKEVTLTDALARAPRGQRPGGAVGTSITAVVEIEFVDTIRNVVHFKGPMGKTRIVQVMKPEFRKMLKKLKEGDKVELTFFEALAISVKPAAK